MYWTRKLNYTFTCNVASASSTNSLSRGKSTFYRNYNRFSVFKNSEHLIDNLDVINTKKKTKDISTFDLTLVKLSYHTTNICLCAKHDSDFVS